MTGEHDLDAPLHDAFEGLASEVRSTSVTSGRVLSQSRNRRQGRRAVLGALAIAVVAAVVVQASLSGGSEAGPSNPNPSPTGAPELRIVPDVSPLGDLLTHALPSRLGPWDQLTPRTVEGGAVACVSDRLATSLGGLSASWTDAYLVSGTPEARKAVARSLSWVSDGESAAQLRSALGSAVARCGPEVHSVSSDDEGMVRWQGDGVKSTVLMVTRGSFLGAVTIDVADTAQGLSPAEETALRQQVFDALEWSDSAHADPATPPPGLAEATALQGALHEGAPVDADPAQAGNPLDDGSPPCEPHVFGDVEGDPRERPQTAGDVLANAVKITATADRRAVLQQGAVRMRSIEGAIALTDQWRGFIADCAPRKLDHASATVAGVRSVPGGYAFDFTVRPNADSEPSASLAPGGTGPRQRTIYLGRTGRVVTFLDVEGAAEHPELRDGLLVAALARLAPEGR